MRSGEKGFTLIELLVVMAIIATLMTFVAPRFFEQTDRAKLVVLEHNLNVMRTAIDHFRRDHAGGLFHLDELIDGGYLRQMPLDPVTNRRDNWEPKLDESGQIIDVDSPSLSDRETSQHEEN